MPIIRSKYICFFFLFLFVVSVRKYMNKHSGKMLIKNNLDFMCILYLLIDLYLDSYLMQ